VNTLDSTIKFNFWTWNLRRSKKASQAQVAGRLGETDDRQARHEAVTSWLYETVQAAKAQSMHLDLMVDQEIFQLNEQHKREREKHEIDLVLMRAELRHQKEAQKRRDGDISELKPMVATLMWQVKGKGKVSDPTPEASRAEG